MSRKVKKSSSFLPQYEGFRPGQEKFQIYLKIKQPTQEDKFDYPNLEIINDQNLLVNASNEKKLSKKEQKEKVYTFNRIFHQRITNEEFFKVAFTGMNQTILVIGPKRSGKTQTTIGSVRDPGILLFFLQDLFNYIEDNFFEDHVTIKLSIFEHHPQRGFRDLLVDSGHEYQPYQQPNGENQLLGIPEIIVENFLLAMKIVRIALANLQQLEQIIDGEIFSQRMRDTSLIFEIKAEIVPTDDIRVQVIVSKARFVKILSESLEEGQKRDDGSLYSELTSIMRLMSEASQQKMRKTTNLSFRNSMLLDYLRVSLTSFSQVTLLCCINADYHDTIRIANYASQILCSKQLSQFSISNWNLQLKELVENQREALNLFTKEFFHHDQKKIKRGKIIFSILNDLQSYFNNFIDILESQGELMYTLNCLYSQVLSNHCQKYQSIITTEDVKEFYLAKIEIYAIDQIKNFQEQIILYIRTCLSQLYARQIDLRQCKINLAQFVNKIDITTYPEITNFDIQKMTNATKLTLKLVSLFTQTAAQNIFNHKEARDTLVYLFQEINQVGGQYLDIMDDLNQQFHEDNKQIQPIFNLDKQSEQSFKESTILSELRIKLPQSQLQQTKHQTRKYKTTLYDNDSDLISKLFKNKNTRNYQHNNMFLTQPIMRSLEHSPTLLMQKQVSDVTTSPDKYNFFQELNKIQKQSGDQKVNPNQIHLMVREWQDKRHFHSTGINFMRQSYSTNGLQVIHQTEDLINEQPKIMMEHRTKPFVMPNQPKYNIAPNANNRSLFPKLNLNQQQFQKFNIK